MKLRLKYKNDTELILNNVGVIQDKIKELQSYANVNKSDWKEHFSSEVFSTSYIEKEVSSRSEIKRDFQSGDNNESMVNNFANAYRYCMQKREINFVSIYILHELLSYKIIDDEDKVEEGFFFRQNDVFIASNSKQEDKGFDAIDIQKNLNSLRTFINNEDIDLYIRAIVGHVYFELIHPFYDFNGRVGRMIPIWVFNNHDRSNEMLDFSTAMGNYKEQYISIFRKNIDSSINKINISKMVEKILDLLILNKKQQSWLSNIEASYNKQAGKNFNSIQKHIIWTLMRKCEVQQNSNSFNKITKDELTYIEKNMLQPEFSRSLKPLLECNIITKTNTKPAKYKLNGYSCFGIF